MTGIKSVIYKEVVNAGEGLRPGCVASASIEVEVYGPQSEAPVAGEALTYYQVDGTETLIGTFYAEPSIPTKKTYKFVAYDAVSKLDVGFSERLNAIQSWFESTSAHYPVTVYDLVSEACSVAGVTLGSSSWPLSTQTVEAFYAEGLTCRNILQYAAEIAGKFVRCNANGEIVFDWYTTSTYSIKPGVDTNAVAYKQDGLSYDNYAVLSVDAVAVRPQGTEGAAYIYPASYSAVTATDPDGDGNVILTNLTVTDDGNGNLYLSVEATDDANNGNVVISDTVVVSNTFIIGDNLLLTNATANIYNAVAQNLYNVMHALPSYRHARITLFKNENPFRAGQFISVTDAQGVSFTTPVFSMTIADNAVLESSGSETYKEAGSTVEKALANLSSNIVQIDKLKVGWADIQEAIIQYLKLYGLMTVYQDRTLALQGGMMGFATANSVIGNGIALIGKLYTAAADPDDPPEEGETESVVAAGEAGVFLGFHDAFDPHYDGGVDVYKPNYPNFVQIDGNGVQLNGRYPLAEIGTLSSLQTSAQGNLVAAINELVTALSAKADSSELEYSYDEYTLNGVLYAFRKWGRVVTVVSSGTCTADIGTGAPPTSAVQVGEKYRPLYGKIFYTQATATTAVQFNLDSGGYLNIGYAGTTIPAGSTIRMSVTYISAT